MPETLALVSATADIPINWSPVAPSHPSFLGVIDTEDGNFASVDGAATPIQHLTLEFASPSFIPARLEVAITAKTSIAPLSSRIWIFAVDDATHGAVNTTTGSINLTQISNSKEIVLWIDRSVAEIGGGNWSLALTCDTGYGTMSIDSVEIVAHESDSEGDPDIGPGGQRSRNAAILLGGVSG